MPEPLAASSPNSAGEPSSESDHALRAEQEVGRLEGLLATRSRELNTLRHEFERRTQLLNEALQRMASASSSELEALRRGYEAAVDRAVEAELARAELTFTLDETRAQLGAAPASGMVSDVRAQRGLYARVAELEETEGSLHARLVLAEQDRDAARQRLRELERELAMENERVELAHAREHTQSSAQLARAGSLAGECAGLRARCAEAEQAFRNAQERYALLERRVLELSHRLDEARSEGAELAIAAHARAARLTEQTTELGLEQQASRAQRAQLAAAVAAHQAERTAREQDAEAWAQRVADLEAQRAADDADVQAWALRVSELESRHVERQRASERDAQTWAARVNELEARFADQQAKLDAVRRHTEAGPSASRAQWRKFLGSLEQPLVALEESLDQLDSEPPRGDFADKLKSEASEADGPNIAQLRKTEEQVKQLEATLAAWRSGAARDGAIAAIKGELIDTRADAARLADDLSRERTRRRRLLVTVRALQAANESGEAVGPWVEELMRIVNEGASLSPSGV